ncbi:sulfurtransferase [Flavobacterium sp. H122]|uniref:sulfurtransferase n=1 Tax=Flavobacterium sp. H122 TaxID=2529860 RepID=UPI0010AA8A4E|nr:sulfurtransferase [Flavobacterium sp. H122]
MQTSPIITIQKLSAIHKNPEIIIFDVSNGKDAKTNYEAEHLEGAFFVDLNTQLAAIKNDVSIGGRHPLPAIEDFAETLSELGITENSHVIIYDDKNGSNAAARFWWMLKAVGHDNVQVLNGGLNEAKKHNFPLSSKKEAFKNITTPYPVTNWKLPLADINEVEKVTQNPDYLVVDVRDKDRYDGKTEPIDLIAGHIPGAVNIPFTENLDANGLFLSPEVLRTKYKDQLKDIAPENIIFHCGSGVTACHSLLALAYAGFSIPKLYVGSWSEWSRNNKKIETNINTEE